MVAAILHTVRTLPAYLKLAGLTAAHGGLVAGVAKIAFGGGDGDETEVAGGTGSGDGAVASGGGGGGHGVGGVGCVRGSGGYRVGVVEIEVQTVV